MLHKVFLSRKILNVGEKIKL